MKLLSILFTLLLVVLVANFAVTNTETVNINLLLVRFKDVDVSLALTLAFAAGVLAGIIAGSAIILRLKRTNARLDRELKAAELKTRESH